MRVGGRREEERENRGREGAGVEGASHGRTRRSNYYFMEGAEFPVVIIEGIFYG